MILLNINLHFKPYTFQGWIPFKKTGHLLQHIYTRDHTRTTQIRHLVHHVSFISTRGHTMWCCNGRWTAWL